MVGLEEQETVDTVIASQRVGAKRRPMAGSAKQSSATQADWIASSQELLAMTGLVHRFRANIQDEARCFGLAP
jgi:hypothetical protein